MFGTYFFHTIGNIKKTLSLKILKLLFVAMIILCFVGCNKEQIKIGHDKNTDYYHITETLRVDNKLGINRTDDKIVIEGYTYSANNFITIFTGKFEKFYCNSSLLAVYTQDEVCVIDINTNEIIKTVSQDEFEVEYSLDSFAEYDL